MYCDANCLYQFFWVMVFGILLFDLWLMLFNKDPLTGKAQWLSHSVGELIKIHSWKAISIAVFICALLLHLFTTFKWVG